MCLAVLFLQMALAAYAVQAETATAGCAPPCTTNCHYNASHPRGNCCNATNVCVFDTVFAAYRCHPPDRLCGPVQLETA